MPLLESENKVWRPKLVKLKCLIVQMKVNINVADCSVAVGYVSSVP